MYFLEIMLYEYFAHILSAIRRINSSRFVGFDLQWIYFRYSDIEVGKSIICRYLRAAKLGEEILVQANTIKTGKTLAFLEVSILNKATGDVLVTGTHTKFVGE